jgi:hypothetical protein
MDGVDRMDMMDAGKAKRMAGISISFVNAFRQEIV